MNCQRAEYCEIIRDHLAVTELAIFQVTFQKYKASMISIPPFPRPQQPKQEDPLPSPHRG